MSTGTKIEWTETTWNPVTGCTKVSEGCDHCYIERTPPFRMQHRRFDKPGVGATTGVTLHPDRLAAPFTWRKPRRVFVNSLSDLFHASVPDEFITQIWAVMASTPQHTYQILTKRPGRMRSFLTDRCPCPNRGHADSVHLRSQMDWVSTRHSPLYVPGMEPSLYHRITWPLPNVWLGVSVESQKWADVRIPALLDTPAAVRWLSCEPLLGPVTLSDDWASGDPARRTWIDWVVAGGESGPGARPMDPAWVSGLRDQCSNFGVPFFFKQWGEWAPHGRGIGRFDPARERLVGAEVDTLGHRVLMEKVGKKAAGRVLDGRTWDEYPAVAS